jgi:hypothetical protein
MPAQSAGLSIPGEPAMPLRRLLLASALLLAATAQATTPAKPYRSPKQIIDASSPATGVRSTRRARCTWTCRPDAW